MMSGGFPTDAMLWGTAATKYATSWPHVDDYGLGTIIKNMSGTKYWVVARPKREEFSNQHRNLPGDLSSRHAFPDTWNTSFAGEEMWDYEGVVLEPGDTL
jgi:hypothetical protein